MAIYHFSAKVISRAVGSSAVAAAAYRSADRLHDERLGRSHDFSNKAGVVHSEVLLPEGADEAWRDRERLWNDVEAAELRKDAQLAREVEFAIPREMTETQGIALARDFVQIEFVDRGMIADLNVHWDIGADGLARPHAHVMLTMREIKIGEDGSAEFGAKVRDWNRTELLSHWREAWADHVNERLAALDIDARVDHRTLDAQGIDLEPQHKIGPAASRMAGQGLDADRHTEHLEIARSNGDRIIADPGIALDAITHRQATFTNRDLAMFVHRHSDGKEQFDRAMSAVKGSPELVALGQDGRGDDRFTSRAMIETEQRFERATATLDARRNHAVAERHRERALTLATERGLDLSAEQRGALEHVTGARGISNVIGYAGTGKSAMLGVAREAWESAGYRVQGAALSGIAAEGLEHGSGIGSRTLASLEHQWGQDRERLTDKHILVIDEAGMVGTRQLERVVSEAERQGAKVVLVGEAFETSRKMAVAVIGANTPLMTLSRAQCRDYIEVLRFLPRNAAKRFPKLSPRQASDQSRSNGGGDTISVANVNVYLGNLSSFLNWAVNEELLSRNPLRGLRLHDEIAKKDKGIESKRSMKPYANSILSALSFHICCDPTNRRCNSSEAATHPFPPERK